MVYGIRKLGRFVMVLGYRSANHSHPPEITSFGEIIRNRPKEQNGARSIHFRGMGVFRSIDLIPIRECVTERQPEGFSDRRRSAYAEGMLRSGSPSGSRP